MRPQSGAQKHGRLSWAIQNIKKMMAVQYTAPSELSRRWLTLRDSWRLLRRGPQWLDSDSSSPAFPSSLSDSGGPCVAGSHFISPPRCHALYRVGRELSVLCVLASFPSPFQLRAPKHLVSRSFSVADIGVRCGWRACCMLCMLVCVCQRLFAISCVHVTKMRQQTYKSFSLTVGTEEITVSHCGWKLPPQPWQRTWWSIELFGDSALGGPAKSSPLCRIAPSSCRLIFTPDHQNRERETSCRELALASLRILFTLLFWWKNFPISKLDGNCQYVIFFRTFRC